MRDRDSLDGERKKLSQNLEKAAKVIEKLTDTEKNLMSRIVSCIVKRGSQFLHIDDEWNIEPS